MSSLGVHSEVGQLKQVIVHRPGLELSRLTPSNAEALLFDDILWVKRAREEHDAFAGALEDRGVVVHHFGDLFAETLEDEAARAYLIGQLCTPERVGPGLVEPLRDLASTVDSQDLAPYLGGAVLKSDIAPHLSRSLTWSALRPEDFVLTPLPNHLFPRDNSCWIYGGVSVNPMAKAARHRETLHMRAIYRHHPLFAGSALNRASCQSPPASKTKPKAHTTTPTASSQPKGASPNIAPNSVRPTSAERPPCSQNTWTNLSHQ